MKKITLLFCFILSCLLASADLPFRNHRYDGFKPLKVHSENIVFIGNSITNMHDWWEAFGNHNIINRGVSGAVSDEVIANLESMIAGKPKKVFLMIGTNDLGTAGMNTTEYVCRNIHTILDRIEQVSPSTEVYVQSILPSSRRDLNLQRQTNDSIRKICAERDITYIDLWDDLISVSQNTNHSLDYLHLSASGYRIWCKKIAPYVGSECVYPDDAANQYNGLGGSYGMRASCFAMAPVREGDVLMIGDEMIHGGEWHELLSCDKVKSRGTGWGFPGPDVATMQKHLKLIFKGRSDNAEPAKVFLYVGAADCNGGTSVTLTTSNYRNLVNEVRSLAPNAKIYLQAVLPLNNASKNTEYVVPFNENLKKMAEEMKNVEFVDTYTPLAQNNLPNSTYMNGNYVYGRGYAKLTQIIAPLLAEEGAKAISDEEAEAQIAWVEARNTLGSAISLASAIRIGENVGEYPKDLAEALLNEIETARQLLAQEGVSLEMLMAEAGKIEAAIQALLPGINPPKVSEGGQEYWYQMYTPQRDNRYLSSNGSGAGVTGEAAHNFEKGMWKFTTNAGGGWNIINREDGSFLNPNAAYNTQVSTTATEPSKGWELSYSGTPGLYIIQSGKVQLNQTQSSLGYKVYNWSAGGTGNDRSDTGCQYALCEAPEMEVPPTAPEPILTLVDLDFNGTAPYRVADELAAPVLKGSSGTVVIDFTQNGNGSPFVLAGSTDENHSAQFFSVTTRSTDRYGVQYIGDNNKEGWYTQGGKNFSSRCKIAVTMNGDTESYAYFFNGNADRTVSGMGEYGYRSFGNVPNVTALYIGGLATADDTAKYVFSGTIHSIRFWDTVLTDREISALEFDHLIPTGIGSVTSKDNPNASAYDLSGRRLQRIERPGIYIINGQKKFVR